MKKNDGKNGGGMRLGKRECVLIASFVLIAAALIGAGLFAGMFSSSDHDIEQDADYEHMAAVPVPGTGWAAADYKIDLFDPASSPGTGYSYNGTTRVLTFTTAANAYTYEIYQSDTITTSRSIIFQTGVSTTVSINGIGFTGNITLDGNASVNILLDGSSVITGSILVQRSSATVFASVTIDSLASTGSSNGSVTLSPTTTGTAGIGGNSAVAYRDFGTIAINGGTVTATGTYNGAGIGGGYAGSVGGTGGPITITGGTVTASGGSTGIGGGSGQGAGAITISGGTVNATNMGASGAGTGGTVQITNDAKVSVTGNLNCTGCVTTITNDAKVSLTGNMTVTGGSASISGAADVNVTGVFTAGTAVTSGTITIGGTAKVTVTNSIRVPAGCTITINGGTVSATAAAGNVAGIGGIYGGSAGTITITGGIVYAKGNSYGAGIGGGDGGTINISGDATVTAVGGGSGGAGIGGGRASTAGNITIKDDAVVNATGGGAGAGIGTGSNGGTGGNITIKDDAVVTARGASGPGLGGMNTTVTISNSVKLNVFGSTDATGGSTSISDAAEVTVTGAMSAGTTAVSGTITIGGTAKVTVTSGIRVPAGCTITITGGTVNATVAAGNVAGIGGPIDQSSGTITITGGIVNAKGNGYGAGIGGGGRSGGGTPAVGNINISGDATVTAVGGTSGSAGIGGGRGQAGGSINISGGVTVTATGGGGGAGIGGGQPGAGGTIVIADNAVVNATGGWNGGAGIGGGKGTGGNGGNVTIIGNAIVTATGGGKASGIGGGDVGTGATLTIDSTADVVVYSSGHKPAIQAVGTNGGSGFYVNARLNVAVSQTADIPIYAFLTTTTYDYAAYSPTYPPYDYERELILPMKYRGFAYTTGSSSTEINYLLADRYGEMVRIEIIDPQSFDIYSVNDSSVLSVRLAKTFTIDFSSIEGHGTISVTVDGVPIGYLDIIAPIHVNSGSNITIKAEGQLVGTDQYEFSYWKGIGSVHSTYSFLIADDYTIGAVFITGDMFVLLSGTVTGKTVDHEGEIWVSINGEPWALFADNVGTALPSAIKLKEGDEVEFEARAISVTAFAYWTGDISGEPNNYLHTMMGNTSVGAFFALYEVQFSIAPGGEYEPIYPSRPMYNFVYNEEFSFTIDVITGYEVTSVTAKFGTGAPIAVTDVAGVYTIYVTNDVKIDITFGVKKYDITLDPDEGFSLEAKPGSSSPVEHNSSYTFVVTALPGYVLDDALFDVTVNGTSVTASLTVVTPGEVWEYTIGNVTADQLVQVTGMRERYTITVTDGKLSVSPDMTYRGEEDLVITVSAATGYHLVSITAVTMNSVLLVEGASDDYTKSGNKITLLIDVDGDIVITAVSAPDEYMITVTDAKLSVSPDATYHDESGLMITISAAAGYHLLSVTAVTMNSILLTEGAEDDYTRSGNEITLLIDVDGDIVITATSAPDEYTITVTDAKLSVSPDATFHDESDLVITISAATGYHLFSVTAVTMNSVTLTPGLTGDYTISDNEIRLLIDVDGDIVITATSAPDAYTITITDSNLSVSPAATYHDESGLVITISAAPGYYLDEIVSVTMNSVPLIKGPEDDYVISGNEITLLIDVDGDIVITATAAPDEYTITVTDAKLSVSPDMAYHDESGLVITVSAATGYHLVSITAVTMNSVLLVEGLTDDYTKSDDQITLLIDVDGNIVITATSAPNAYSITVSDAKLSVSPDAAYHDESGLAMIISVVPAGYHLGAITAVEMNSVILYASEDYTISGNTITLLIDVDGDIAITATAEPDVYSITVTDSNLSVSPVATYHDESDLVITVSVATGYHLVAISSVTMNSVILVGTDDYTIAGDQITLLIDVDGDIVITATAELNVYTITVTDVNLSVSPDATYHGENDLAITISVIPPRYHLGPVTSVEMNGTALNVSEDYTISGNIITLLIPVDGDIVITAAVIADEYTVTVLSEEGRTFRYSDDEGLTWTEFTMDASGEKDIIVGYGKAFWIEALDSTGYSILWLNSLKKVVGEGPEYRIDYVNNNFELTASFSAPEKSKWGLLWIVIVVCTTLMILMLYYGFRRCRVAGTVTHNGEGIGGVEIKYRIEGDADGTERDSVVTDGNGNYSIIAEGVGSVVVITSVGKIGYVVDELPEPIRVEKGTVRSNMTMSKK